VPGLPEIPVKVEEADVESPVVAIQLAEEEVSHQQPADEEEGIDGYSAIHHSLKAPPGRVLPTSQPKQASTSPITTLETKMVPLSINRQF